MGRRFALRMILGIAFTVGAHAQTVSPLPRAETRQFTSKINGFTYDVFVALPESYARSTAARFPVVYLTDANWTFAMTVQTYQVMRLTRQVPEAIFIGIARAGVDETAALATPPRSLDLTPTRDAVLEKENSQRYGRDVHTGGAPEFLRVLRDELIPDTEGRYRTTADRTFIGYSLGGLFGAYTLFQSPETFKRMILVSPSLWWGDNLPFKWEETYASTHKNLSVRLFMSDGELEAESMLGTMRRMATALSGRNYPGLDLHTRIFEGENHTTTFPVAVTRGLKTVFAEQPKP